MPLLARMLAAPLDIDVRRGRGRGAGRPARRPVHLRRRARRRGVGPGQGEQIGACIAPSLRAARGVHRRRRHASTSAVALAATLRRARLRRGGRHRRRHAPSTRQVRRDAGGPADGRRGHQPRPRRHRLPGRLPGARRHGKGSYGVQCRSPSWSTWTSSVRSRPLVRSGIGDVVSNLSAHRGLDCPRSVSAASRVDGLAARHGPHGRRSGAASAGLRGQRRLPRRAGRVAGPVAAWRCPSAGTSRPCSGGCHEIIHAVDGLFPGASNHGELAGIGALFCHLPAGGPGPLRPDGRLPAPARPAADAGRTSA